VFVSHIKREQNLVQRVDVVWNQNLENSLKAQTRENCTTTSGTGQKRRAEVSTPIPKNWLQYLCVDETRKWHLVVAKSFTSLQLMRYVHPLAQEDPQPFQTFTLLQAVIQYPTSHELARTLPQRSERPTKNLLMLSMACIMFQRKSLKRLNHP